MHKPEVIAKAKGLKFCLFLDWVFKMHIFLAFKVLFCFCVG